MRETLDEAGGDVPELIRRGMPSSSLSMKSSCFLQVMASMIIRFLLATALAVDSSFTLMSLASTLEH